MGTGCESVGGGQRISYQAAGLSKSSPSKKKLAIVEDILPCFLVRGEDERAVFYVHEKKKKCDPHEKWIHLNEFKDPQRKTQIVSICTPASAAGNHLACRLTPTS